MRFPENSLVSENKLSRKTQSGFVSGHDFRRAAMSQKGMGLEPPRPAHNDEKPPDGVHADE